MTTNRATDPTPSALAPLLQYLTVVLLLAAFGVGLYGVAYWSGDKAVAIGLVVLSLGAFLFVLFSHQFSEFSVGLDGFTAKRLEDKLGQLEHRLHLQFQRDLLAMRYQAYGALWAQTHHTALFVAKEFDPDAARKLADALTAWYFSPTGGLLLSVRARDFYLPLQDFLRTTAALTGWRCDPRPSRAEAKALFAELLAGLELADGPLRAQAALAQKQPEKLDPKVWEAIYDKLTDHLTSLVKDEKAVRVGEKVFAAVQQVTSILRTNLAAELQSRLDVEWPAAPPAGT